MKISPEKILYKAELVVVIIDGKLQVLKNRNMITRSDLIKLLEKL